MNSNDARLEINLLKELTLPGLFTLKKGRVVTICSPFTMDQTWKREPARRRFITRLLPRTDSDDVLAASPEASTASASASDGIYDGILTVLTKLSGMDLPLSLLKSAKFSYTSSKSGLSSLDTSSGSLNSSLSSTFSEPNDSRVQLLRIDPTSSSVSGTSWRSATIYTSYFSTVPSSCNLRPFLSTYPFSTRSPGTSRDFVKRNFS